MKWPSPCGCNGKNIYTAMKNICTTDLQQPPRQVDGHHVVDAAGEEAGGGEVLQHDPAEETVSKS